MYGKIGKRDDNEKAIVKNLESVGAVVERLHTPADLLVGFRDKVFLIEIKSEAGKPTKKQKINKFKKYIKIARSSKKAIEIICKD